MVNFSKSKEVNIFNPSLTSSNLPKYDAEGNKISILDLYNFNDLCEDYIIDLEIRNYSRNTIKTYCTIINNFIDFLKTQDDLTDDKKFLRSFKRYIQYLKRDKEVSQNYIYIVTITIK